MNTTIAISRSLSSLGKALRSAFRVDHRRNLRLQVSGKLYLFSSGKDGQVQLDEVGLKDIFAGGFAFRSDRLICIGNHICISDGVDALEVCVDHRRQEGSGFVYVVSVGQLGPLVESWQDRLEPEVSLMDLLQRCRELSAESNAIPSAS